jgi:cytochrome c oxidase assembly protein subunit 15
VIALGFALRATDGPARVRRAVATLLGVVLAQGLVGYVQYFTGLPEVLVGVHLLGACLVWVAALDVWLSSTELVPRAAPRPAVPPVWETGVRGR